MIKSDWYHIETRSANTAQITGILQKESWFANRRKGAQTARAVPLTNGLSGKCRLSNIDLFFFDGQARSSKPARQNLEFAEMSENKAK